MPACLRRPPDFTSELALATACSDAVDRQAVVPEIADKQGRGLLAPNAQVVSDAFGWATGDEQRSGRIEGEARFARRSQAVAAPHRKSQRFADERGVVWRCRGVIIWPRL